MSKSNEKTLTPKAFGRKREPLRIQPRDAPRSLATVATKRSSRPIPSKLISVQQFCDAYSLGKTRAYELLNSGEITAIKSGHRTLILLDSVEAWIERLQPFGANT